MTLYSNIIIMYYSIWCNDYCLLKLMFISNTIECINNNYYS